VARLLAVLLVLGLIASASPVLVAVARWFLTLF
jgi:hypothetical protein